MKDNYGKMKDKYGTMKDNYSKMNCYYADGKDMTMPKHGYMDKKSSAYPAKYPARA
jgi:hypothetical protein